MNRYQRANCEALPRDPTWAQTWQARSGPTQAGSQTLEVIRPDAEFQSRHGHESDGTSATRIPSARAGFAQGKQEATRLTVL